MILYNDNNPEACAWMRELIADGLIPRGDVSEKSISELDPDEVRRYTQFHAFCGIAGWPYACALAGIRADESIWTGSCPCQPYSAAGKQLGDADPRNLWPAFFRLIRECRPLRVFGEQVPNAIGHGWLDGISSDLEKEGYAVGAIILGAHSVGAPHLRQRLFWCADRMADSGGERRTGQHALLRTEAGGRGAEEISEAAGSGADLGLADANRGQRLGLADGQGREYHGAQAGRIEGDGIAECGGASGGLANPHGRQPGDGNLQRGGQHGQREEDRGVGGRPGDADDAGSQGWEQRGDGSEQWPAGSPGLDRHWSRTVWHPCTDGKFRRVPADAEGRAEPALFPLVAGVPGRVGLLRGAGNAVSPQVTALFLRACRGDRPRVIDVDFS